VAVAARAGPAAPDARPAAAGGDRGGGALTVLGFGDSITCGPEEGAFGVAPRAWAQWLAEAQDQAFHRVARAGATTPWMAEHLLPRVGEGYALACVHVGTNDVRGVDWDAAAYTVALGTILGTLRRRAARVCVATVPHDLGRPRAGAKVAELGGVVRRLAAEHGAVVVDLDDLRGWRSFFPDAVHPTALGQVEIADRAAAALLLDVQPSVFAGVRRGVRHDVRYAFGRQAAHLLRDWRRRTGEGARRRLIRRRASP
jgi:lysophospholipase L1-like esterase